jgi:hypothetical protein
MEIILNSVELCGKILSPLILHLINNPNSRTIDANMFGYVQYSDNLL